MTRLPKVIGIGLLSGTVIATGTLTWLRFALVTDPCERFSRVLARSSQGSSAVYSVEICRRIGTIINASVDVVSPSGRSETAFRFLPVYGLVRWRASEVIGPAEPIANWTSPGSLRVSIGTVGTVLQQRSQVGATHVTYDIRKNLHIEKADYGD
jgi:hypothetical protein